MLDLIDITKDYTVGTDKVHALKGVTLSFRRSEFVSILGPSGCGKTTLLNIIGGLDHYTSGDLVIEGISTKQYTGRDWDTYRNHRIGFVFQSYNLIPHQTILENVELALTIAGMSKTERVQKAKDALDKVGLKDLYNKKPNQLSGGQCQRVAIARALVGDPEILLADEPTGALDTVTSTQIMDLIKEIASERLVIMVTHNPDIAEKYSTRIINLLDGNITGDSNPFDPATEDEAEPAAAGEAEQGADEPLAEKSGTAGNSRSAKSDKKSKLSFFTAFRLSMRNLLSKLKRTILVCIAGSIGIIGVATVLSVSTGVTLYIEKMQNEMLSGNPITISQSAMNMEGLMAMQDMSLLDQSDVVKQSVVDGKINVDYMIKFLAERSDDLSSLVVTNTITEDYKAYLDAMPADNYASFDYKYGLNMNNNIYTDYHFTDHDGERMSLTAAQQMYTALLGKTDYADYASLVSLVSINYRQAPSNEEFITSQYDILTPGGHIATKENEIMLVVDENTALTDLLLAQLGYYNQEQFLNIAYKVKDDPENPRYDPAYDKDMFDYDELIGKRFTWYPNDMIFSRSLSLTNPFTYNAVASDSWTDGVELEVTAILRPKEGMSYSCMSSGIYYTNALTQKALSSGASSQIVKFLIDNKDTDNYKLQRFSSGHIKVAELGLEVDVGITYKYSFSYDGVQYNNNVGFVGSQSQITSLLGQFGGEQMGSLLSELENMYYLTLRELGGAKLPSSVSIYAIDFARKDLITDYLDAWNADADIQVGDKVIKKEEREKIIYSDTIGLIIGLIDNMITAVTAALIAFTALSLVVSTVMIAIITYVSVIERVKEIGVIRSLGGRKRDVSALFICETFIIGLISGIIGIIITFFLTLIINGIVNSFVSIGALATLTVPIIFIMIGVSVVLTLISGVAPARLAAKKDPVEALRSE